MSINDKKISVKIFVIISGIAFLASSLSGLANLISQSMSKPVSSESAAQSQEAELGAAEKGFRGVLKREPKNETAIRGILEIIKLRMQQGDFTGAKVLIEDLVKINPTNKEYQGLLTAVNKQISISTKVGTLKPTASTASSK